MFFDYGIFSFANKDNEDSPCNFYNWLLQQVPTQSGYCLSDEACRAKSEKRKEQLTIGFSFFFLYGTQKKVDGKKSKIALSPWWIHGRPLTTLMWQEPKSI